MIPSSHSVRNTLLTTLATTCLSLGATVGHAADQVPEHATLVVQYADLNLASPPGVERLYKRIASAARQVCEANEDKLQNIARLASCVKQSIGRAVAAVGSPQLTALYASRAGEPTAGPGLARR